MNFESCLEIHKNVPCCYQNGCPAFLKFIKLKIKSQGHKKKRLRELKGVEGFKCMWYELKVSAKGLYFCLTLV